MNKLYLGSCHGAARRCSVMELGNFSPPLLQGLLNPRHDLFNHSPDGFAWGYSGSGPAQLALALCADALADGPAALRIYQHFKEAFVAVLPQDEPFAVSDNIVRHIIERVRS